MNEAVSIAPTGELLRYLCLFHRWLAATRRYVRDQDADGVILSAWSADALHNVPSILWRYSFNMEWKRTVEIADWVEHFPQVIRQSGAPERIAADCDWIFSPEGATADLRLADDLSDLDLAPPEEITPYLDLFFFAFIDIRWRPARENPWQRKDEHWKEREAGVTARLGTLADLMADVPSGLVHWRSFDEQRFAESARTIWKDWPWAFGLDRIQAYRTVDRLRPLWLQSLPTTAQGLAVNFALQWLVTQYAQPWRAYHNVSHVERIFRIWQGVAQTVPVIDPIGMALAIWFHDVVYDPKRHDNELQSADEAEHQFARLGIDEARIGSIRRMILATASHKVDDGEPDTALLLDLDLEILGAEPEEYDAYSRAIRQEYSFVSDPDYRAGRTRVLRRFLEPSRIYVTDPMFARYEEQARRNIGKELSALENET